MYIKKNGLFRFLLTQTGGKIMKIQQEGNRLFITATTSLYAVYLAVNGAVRP